MLVLCCAALLVGCGATPLQREPFECPPAAEVPRYSELRAVATCIGCHDSTLSAEARNGAPTPINFETSTQASRAAVIALSAMERGAMPPDTVVDEADILQWRTWSACGRPE